MQKESAGEKIRSPDIKGLREFARRGDRQDPPAFAGRKEQIDGLAEDLQDRMNAWRSGSDDAWKGAIWLFQGAPGAGKTALLSRLKSLAMQVPGDDRSIIGDMQARVCTMDDEVDLYDDFRLKRKIAEAFVPCSAAKMLGTDTTQTGKGAKVGGGVSGFGARLEGSADASKGKSEQRAGLTWEDFANKEKSQNSSPLLLLFDEAQALEDQAGPQLRWLHKGEHGLPIVPVFGGLAWTKERFGELGISRFSAGRVHTLEALSKDECREVAKAFFGKFDVAGVDQEGEKWEDLIVRRSQGWPQHLHAGLQALAGGLVKEGVDGDLERLDGKAVLQDEAERRKRYYQDRLGSGYLKSKRHLAAAAVARLDEFPEGATRSRMAGIVQEISDRAGGSGAHNDLALPKGMDAADFVGGMMKSGVFHEDRDGYLSVPIPSFRDFLIERYPAPDQGAAPETGNPPSPAP